MNATNQKTSPMAMSAAIFLTALLVAAPPAMSRAEAWELRTVDKEVPGTREIESGDVKKGIKISKIYLSSTPSPQKVAVLTNLCIGHIMIKDFAQAGPYCDQAVAHKLEGVVTHNNRGVLKALQGDFEAARSDFWIAADIDCDDPCSSKPRNSSDLPRHVARRNLESADTRLLVAKKASNTRRTVAQNDQ